MLFTSTIHFWLSLSLSLLTDASPAAAGGCSAQKRLAGVKQLVKTIKTHSFADAAKIPLAPSCTRLVIVYPKELGGNVPVPVPAGENAATVRAILAGGGAALFAGVKNPSYIVNNNGSVTFDLIQTDVTALPYTKFREVHNYDLSTCEITSIFGWGFGDVLPSTILTDP